VSGAKVVDGHTGSFGVEGPILRAFEADLVVPVPRLAPGVAGSCRVGG
jgi:hypothetical protein